MHQHVSDPIELLSYALLYVVGNFVRLPHRHLGIDFQVQIDMVSKSGLSGITLLDPAGAWHAGCDVTNLVHETILGHGVH